MSEQILGAGSDEDILKRALYVVLREVVPRESRTRAIENAAAWRARSVPSGYLGWKPWLMASAAAVLLILTGVGLHALLSRGQNSIAPPYLKPSPSPSPIVRSTDPAPRSIGAMWTTGARMLVAEQAPLIVANGGLRAISLGAVIAQRDAGGSVHVWDWSKSEASRILPGEEWWSNQLATLSPDGRLLVRASGEILDLQTGRKSPIDLGGESYQIGVATYQRIGSLRISPDGGRLAMSITTFVEGEPGHIQRELIHIVDFPGGKPLCQFPAGSRDVLCFSETGKEILVGNSSRQLTLRNADTGAILRQFVPPADSQIMGLAFSPDGRTIAACERMDLSNGQATKGDLYLWSTASGELLHRISGTQFHKLGGLGPIYGALRFSPDGKCLAAESWGRVFIIDVATGEIAATIKQDSAGFIHWSADGSSLTFISPIGAGEGGGELPAGRYDIYPSVHEWDWRNAKLIRSWDKPQTPSLK